MTLAELAAAIGAAAPLADGERLVSHISYDSRLVLPGSLFVAIAGFHVDGHSFIAAAIEAGAVAVVTEPGRAPAACPVPVLEAADTRLALALAAAALAGNPSRRLTVVGVTGTDGKTSTSFMIEHVLRHAGLRTGLIGTVAVRVGDRLWDNDSRQTTPEAPEIQQLLAEMVADGVQVAVVETSSHALALHRVAGIEYDVAVLTNFSSDHLEFHKTRDAYLDAKSELFRMVAAEQTKSGPHTRVLNADDATFGYLRSLTNTPLISFGVDQPATVVASDIVVGARGLEFMVTTPDDAFAVQLQMAGRFNVSNALAAAAVALALEVPTDMIAAGLASLPGVPGRMERIDAGQPFDVIVDYAHTTDALEKVLRVLRPVTEGQLVAVFGCAGERDTSKRRPMGRVAGELADFVVITNEDPRREDELAILREIEAGLMDAGRKRGADYLVVPDRGAAVQAAVERAVEGDTIMLAGKGHEQCIIVGETKLPWNDRVAALAVLAELGYGRPEVVPDRGGP